MKRETKMIPKRRREPLIYRELRRVLSDAETNGISLHDVALEWCPTSKTWIAKERDPKCMHSCSSGPCEAYKKCVDQALLDVVKGSFNNIHVSVIHEAMRFYGWTDGETTDALKRLKDAGRLFVLDEKTRPHLSTVKK